MSQHAHPPVLPGPPQHLHHSQGGAEPALLTSACVPQVRDRATLYLAQLGGSAGGAHAIVGQPDVSLDVLEKNLAGYLESGNTEQPFDLVCVLVCCARVVCVLCVCVCV